LLLQDIATLVKTNCCLLSICLYLWLSAGCEHIARIISMFVCPPIMVLNARTARWNTSTWCHIVIVLFPDWWHCSLRSSTRMHIAS